MTIKYANATHKKSLIDFIRQHPRQRKKEGDHPYTRWAVAITTTNKCSPNAIRKKVLKLILQLRNVL